jgi:DNA polymerase-3 subunit delta
MVTIAHRNADEYVQNPQPSHHMFLVYGTDAGLVSERSRTLLRTDIRGKTASHQTISLSGDVVASDPNILLDEIHSLKLFDQGPSAIRLSIGARNLVPALELAMKGAPFEARIVVEAGPLKPTAPLRKWFESQGLAAAIACYSDQSKDLRRLIVQQMSTCGGSIESDAVELLVEILGEDRGISRSEMEKLCLYANGQHAITSRDVSEILATSSSIDGGDMIMDAIFGNMDATIDSLSAIGTQISEFNSVSANALKHIVALHCARIQIAAGSGRDAALENFLRSLNAFKKKQEISIGLNLDDSVDTVQLINSFYDLVREARHNSLLAEPKLARALIALANVFRKMQKKGIKRLDR